MLATLRPLTATASGPLGGTIRIPGDKSISHRALMFAALAIGETHIAGLLEGEDVLRTAAAMRALGAAVTQDGPGQWRVAGRGLGRGELFAVMTGDASLRGRPMRRVTEPLAMCGAQFQSRDGGRLPLAIRGAKDALPLKYRLPVASAQVKSALMLAGLNARGWTTIEEPEPTRDHSERMLRHFGATVEVEPHGTGRIIRLLGQPDLVASDILVPGDPSSAAFPLVAALITPGSEVTVRGVGLNALRTGLLTTLREMGGQLVINNERIEGGEPVGDITARHSLLMGVEVPASRAPSMIDEYPILAVAAAYAEGRTLMLGLGELRVKESDRLNATAALLQANGVRVTAGQDTLTVEGGAVPGGGLVPTHMDHRIAMSALVLGLAASAPVRIDDGAFIETSFPDFVGLMAGLGGRIA